MPTKFYLRRAASEVQGTLPATNASASATAPTWTPGASNGQIATPLLTNRTLSPTIGTVAQTSLAYTTANSTTNQTQPFLRFVSPPLTAQTIAAQSISVQSGYSCSNTASFFQTTCFIGVWRPSTGARIGTLVPVGQFVSNSATASQGLTNNNFNGAAVTCADGDVLVVEIWRGSGVQTMGTAYTNTVFYDGTTEASTSNIAATLTFVNNVTLQTLPAEITLRAATSGSGSTTPFTMPLPAGATDGDLLIVWAESALAVSAGGPLVAPSGWTKGTTLSPATGMYCCFYWAQYSAALSRSFALTGGAGAGSGWCVGAYYKTGEVLDLDGAAVAAYVTGSNTTVNTGQPVTTGPGRFEVVAYHTGLGGTMNAAAGITIDTSETSGGPSSQGYLGHNLTHPLGSGVTCPAFVCSTTANVANKTGAGLLLKAAPLVTEPANPTIGGPADAFAA